MSSMNDEEIVVWMSYLMIAAALIVLVGLKFLVAPYGRYSPQLRQYALNARFAWLVQESPSLLVPILVWGYGSSNPNFVNKVFLVLFLVHYFHRTFIFSILIRSSNSVHLYTFLPALVICSYNGFLQSKHLLITKYPSDWMYSWQCITGVLLFFGGMFINIHSDHILRNLRKPGETGYKIPKGGMFEYVTGANYFGEIVEWIGFAIACWSLPAFAFALMTVCNTGPRAIQYHSWYLTKFKDYPRERKALIPYVL